MCRFLIRQQTCCDFPCWDALPHASVQEHLPLVLCDGAHVPCHPTACRRLRPGLWPRRLCCLDPFGAMVSLRRLPRVLAKRLRRSSPHLVIDHHDVRPAAAVELAPVVLLGPQRISPVLQQRHFSRRLLLRIWLNRNLPEYMSAWI